MRISREEYYLRCPKCYSPNVSIDGAIGNNNKNYRCGDCGQKMILDIKNKKLILGSVEPQWVKI